MKKLVITIVVIVLVLVAVDFGLAAAAEYQVAKKMRSELNLADDPSVDIRGFPFLTQAISGDYSDISVIAKGVPVQDKLRDLEVDADLRHLHVPLSDLLSGNVAQVKIDEVDGQVQLKADDLGRLLDTPDLQIIPQSLDALNGVGSDEAQQRQNQQQQQANGTTTANYTNQAGLELTGTVNFAGQQTKVSVYALITLSGGTIGITAKKVELANQEMSGPLADSIERQFLPKFSIQLSPSQLPLPFAVRPTGIVVMSGALLIQGTAQNVVLGNPTSQGG